MGRARRMGIRIRGHPEKSVEWEGGSLSGKEQGQAVAGERSLRMWFGFGIGPVARRSGRPGQTQHCQGRLAEGRRCEHARLRQRPRNQAASRIRGTWLSKGRVRNGCSLCTPGSPDWAQAAARARVLLQLCTRRHGQP